MTPPGRDSPLRDFDISVEVPRAGMLVVRVRGALDLVAAPRLRDTVNARLTCSRPCRLVLDLSDITLLSSAGLGLLAQLRRRSRADGVHLVLVGTGHRAVHQPLRLSGLLPLFDVWPTVGHAVKGSGTGRGTTPKQTTTAGQERRRQSEECQR